MHIILPAHPGSANLEKFKSTLTPELIEQMVQNSTVRPSIIGMPKMRLSSTLRLQSALESLGLHSLFDPSLADLSILSAGRGPANATTDSKQERPVADQPAKEEVESEKAEIDEIELEEEPKIKKVKKRYSESTRNILDITRFEADDEDEEIEVVEKSRYKKNEESKGETG